MGWKKEALSPELKKRLFDPNGIGQPKRTANETSPTSLAAGPQARQPEPTLRHEPLEAATVPRYPKARTHLRFSQFTRRRIDPDNCCCKYEIDWLRAKGFIPDDTDDDVELTVRQIQVRRKEDEGVLIEVLPTDTTVRP